MSIDYDEKEKVFSQAEAFPLPIASNPSNSSSVIQPPPDTVASFPNPSDNPDIVTLKQYQSPNFVKSISGWGMDSDGNAEFNNGIFRGTFILGGTLVTINDINKLQDALDTVEGLGGGTVSLVPDTYTATSSFTLASGVTFNGNGATIDFGGGAYQFLIQGTNAYSTGTLSVNFGSGSVTGVGTTWTAAMIGRSILIGDYWYTITARASNTAITISPFFRAPSVSGVTYVIATTIDTVALLDVTLTNSSISALKYRYVNGITLDGLVTTDSAQAIDGDDSAYTVWINGQIVNCVLGITYNNVPFSVIDNSNILDITGGTALDLNGVSNTAVSALSIQNVTGVGMKFTNCYDLGLINFAYIKCSSHGIEFVSGNRDINASEGYIDSCGGDGVKFTASSDTVQIFGNSVLNNTGYGINISDSSCDNNVVSCNTLTNNTAGDVNDVGTGTIINANVPASINSTIGVRLKAIETLAVGDLLDVLSISDPTAGTTDSATTFGKVTTLKKISFRVPGTGVAMSSMKISLLKVGAPVDNVTIRIETDSAGLPSGNLVNANATATVSGASITTSLAAYIITFAGSFTPTLGTNYWIVFYRDGAESNTDYYVAGAKSNTGGNAGFLYATNDGSWHSQDTTYAWYITAAAGLITSGVVKNRSATISNNMIGLALSATTIGSAVAIGGRGTVVTGLSGLAPGAFYPASATAGALGTATYSSAVNQVGQALSETSFHVIIRP